MPNTAHAGPVRFFALLLIPLSCWQVWIFPAIPNYYAQHFLLYPALLFLLWALWRRLWTVREAWGLVRPALPWLVLVLMMQAMAGWESAVQYAPQRPLWAVVKELLKLLVQLPFLLLFLLLCRILMRDAMARCHLLWGALASFVLLAALCAVQGLWVYSESYEWLVDTGLAGWCQSFLQQYSPWLEARWADSVYDFYTKGGYSLSEPRFNGFFEEASALSAMVGVFFVPLCFGLLALRQYGFRMAALAGCVGIVLCLGMLILCRAATGQILALVTLLLLLSVAVRGGRKLLKLGGMGVLVAVCVYGALELPYVSHYFVDKTEHFDVPGSPRVITLLDTVDIIKENPWIGIGRGWYFPHLHSGPRYLRNLDDPEMRAWKERGSGGELSALPSLAAQYGLPAVLAGLLFVGYTWWRLQERSRHSPGEPMLAFMAHAATVWCVVGGIAALAALDIRNPLFCLPFFCFCVLAYGLDLQDADDL